MSVSPEYSDSVADFDGSVRTSYRTRGLRFRAAFAWPIYDTYPCDEDRMCVWFSSFGVLSTHDAPSLDDSVQLRWFDRQGTIVSTQFNLRDDLDLFVSLIVAFSRFSVADWGIIGDLYPKDGFIKYPLGKDRILEIDMKVKPLCHSVRLHSRGTMILQGEIHAGTSKTPVVIKVSNPEKWRSEESFFIKRGLESSKGAHFARIYYDKDLGSPTGDVRECLGLERGWERQCQMIVFEPLDRITSLTDPNDILQAWLDCLKGKVLSM